MGKRIATAMAEFVFEGVAVTDIEDATPTLKIAVNSVSINDSPVLNEDLEVTVQGLESTTKGSAIGPFTFNGFSGFSYVQVGEKGVLCEGNKSSALPGVSFVLGSVTIQDSVTCKIVSAGQDFVEAG